MEGLILPLCDGLTEELWEREELTDLLSDGEILELGLRDNDTEGETEGEMLLD
jgi:hypothetical protein